MVRYRLPVSGIEVCFRQPTGDEDLLLLDADVVDDTLEVALQLVSALAVTPEGGRLAWSSLSISDLDAALLSLRRFVLGNRIASTVRCGCGEAIDIDFGVHDYLAGHLPHTQAGARVTACEDGWYRLGGSEARFRLPTCVDFLELRQRADAVRELERRCVESVARSGGLRRRIETAMSVLAPSLYGALETVCPACAATMQIAFDPQRYVLDELKQRAGFLLDEVHIIADRYRWSERDILALPQARRLRYAELLFDASAGA